jgi:hypothetical protein
MLAVLIWLFQGRPGAHCQSDHRPERGNQRRLHVCARATARFTRCLSGSDSAWAAAINRHIHADSDRLHGNQGIGRRNASYIRGNRRIQMGAARQSRRLRLV